MQTLVGIKTVFKIRLKKFPPDAAKNKKFLPTTGNREKKIEIFQPPPPTERKKKFLAATADREKKFEIFQPPSRETLAYTSSLVHVRKSVYLRE